MTHMAFAANQLKPFCTRVRGCRENTAVFRHKWSSARLKYTRQTQGLRTTDVICAIANLERQPAVPSNPERTPIDEFVGSTPAIEQTVRLFCKDLVRCKHTTSMFAADVEYKDGMRSFKGMDKYCRRTWVATNIQRPQVTITQVSMLDKGSAKVNWTVKGAFTGQTVEIKFESVIEMNLLTARITKHRESWDLSSCGFPTSLAITANRAMWSARQATQDASDKVARSVDTISGSFDENDNIQQANPMDPTRFFQQPENPMKDYIALTTFIAIMYLVYRGFEAVEKLP